jgi:hypothetical protein
MKEKDICKLFYKRYQMMKAYNQFPNNAFVFHIANEQNCSKHYTIELMRMGLTAGVADYCVMANNNRSGYLEFKRNEKCKLTPKQLEFKIECEAREIPYTVVWDAQAAIEFVMSI